MPVLGPGATTLPSLASDSASGLGSAASALPLVQASATGVAYIDGGVVLPAITGQGDVHSGRGVAILPAITARGVLISGGLNVGATTLPILQSDGAGGRGGFAETEIPAIEATGLGYAEIAFSADTDLPLVLSGPARILRALEELYETWAVEATYNGHTTYDGFPFNSFGEINGTVYAANANGIYALGGDDDDGVNIDAEVMYGVTDFYYDGQTWGLKAENATMKKRLHTAYVMVRKRGDKTPEIALLLKVDEDKYREYTVDMSSDAEGKHLKRIRDTGRGLTGRFWQPGFKNKNGADFEVSFIELYPIILSRRV